MSMSMTQTDPEATRADLSVERWAATSGSERTSRANLVLTGGGHRWRANADGNGAIDALMRAVDNALAPVIGTGVILTSFEVHATGAGHEAQASVTLGVRRAEDGPTYPGHAVHENVLQASVVAYVDALNTMLADEGVDLATAKPAPGATPNPKTDPAHRSSARDRIMSAYNP